ncbi:MAG TPA: aminodeoxychorismate synthase component I [Vicinamibacterales bacterium]|nr:aminodeoxychorismate synthase component I [Vicinamibacterales bacterium]
MADIVIHVDRGARWLRLQRPVRVIEVRDAVDLDGALREIEHLGRQHGYHAAGFITYEAGRAYGLRTCEAERELPLAWFALFDSAGVSHLAEPEGALPYHVGPLTPSVDRAAFDHAFAAVRRHIADGDTYQVNYTFDLQGRFDGDPFGLFVDLTATQRGRYAAYIHTGAHAICSASPELFFSRLDGTIEARPMKGTARRGRTLAEDDSAAARLRASSKERAENVMIVDMMRNDLGRIADTGTVTVPDLLAVERYPTLWQMTSTVTARSSASLADIFAALHPSASVTGAPKVRTMEIISELERRPRGVYTGAIGYIAPDGSAQFNVAIRTAVIDIASGRLTYGVGSGIVWDSDAASEYQECLLKSAILARRPHAFDLLETMRWSPHEGFFLLARHVRRMRQSAQYFDYPMDERAIERALAQSVDGKLEPQRVRLLLSRTGAIRVECTALGAAGLAPARLGIAAAPVDPSNIFLFHKTTHREMYTNAMQPDCDDVVLWTADGAITETTLGNIVVEIAGRKVTPPVDTGLLAGTFREELLERGDIVEGRLTLDDLQSASRVWIVNSVREWWPAEVTRHIASAAATTPIVTSSTMPTAAKRSQR